MYNSTRMEGETNINQRRFVVVDYVVMAVMLIGCSLIGLYLALKGKRNADAATEYLMGGRNMKVFPIALSLVASFISGITLLGNPTETYLYGTQYMFFPVSLFFVGFIAGYVYLPVFHDMEVASTYHYLEKRYDKNVRLLGSLLFTIALICWLPIVIYVPALAFNHVSGVNVHIITPCLCVVCIFYTALGGLKAVVWTDVIQTFMMVGAMIIVIVKGISDIGGIDVVWERCWESGRIEFPSLQLDFTTRHSIYALLIGGIPFWLQSSILNQNMIQRYMALPNLQDVRRALWIFVAGTIFLIFICCSSGLVVYSTYYDCDPLTSRMAKAPDQLLPLMVMRVLGDYSGMPGFFVAGIFSAALSSLSTGLNSMAAVVLEDFIKPYFPTKLSNRATDILLKNVVILFGGLCIGLVFAVEKLGAVLQLSMSLSAVTSGPAFAIFSAGVLFPWVNGKGAFYGGLIGIAISSFVVLGTQNEKANGNLKIPMKPVSVEGCNFLFNSTEYSIPSVPEEPDVFFLFKMSYMWYTIFGAIVTFILSVIISFMTGSTDFTKLDPLCLSPVIRKHFVEKKRQLLRKNEEELIEVLKNEVENENRL
ncbi:UNVERIFIED_CONTAM: hypothetical protein PYX00_000192 [Menopon gallinae]|uniref:Sodium-coupled monocarboxylate transporter 1 n=1 Tax=Menopon gallinae TaxID=328185 RepID=A0AAW2I885_9NEOP